jgi:hypothetical protein
MPRIALKLRFLQLNGLQRAFQHVEEFLNNHIEVGISLVRNYIVKALQDPRLEVNAKKVLV